MGTIMVITAVIVLPLLAARMITMDAPGPLKWLVGIATVAIHAVAWVAIVEAGSTLPALTLGAWEVSLLLFADVVLAAFEQ